MTVTSAPRSDARIARVEPMKPAPPVINTFVPSHVDDLRRAVSMDVAKTGQAF